MNFGKILVADFSGFHGAKVVIKMVKLHEKIANCSWDTLHKVSYSLVKENRILLVENLNVKGIMKNKKLAKHIIDAPLGKIFADLKGNLK